jgi:hypothetical protein
VSQILISKSITASSSNTLGIFSSATTATTYTSGVSFSIGTTSGSVATNLDTSRRIIVWSSALASDSLLITVTGRNDSGASISEIIHGSTVAGTPIATTQDFLSVTSVSFSSLPNAAIHFGTNTQAGTPWKMFDTNIEQFNFSMQMTFNSTISTTLTNLELTLDDPTQTVSQGARFLSSTPTIQVPFVPISFIPALTGSTALSTANASQTAPAFGNITAPAIAWRATLTSSSSTAGGVFINAMQYGV